ncbi:MAG: dodecin [Methanobacteriota archaeon]
MTGTYKMLQLVGTSTKGIEDAVAGALKKASESLHGLAWFEVVETRGRVGASAKVEEWQVKIDVGFKVD